MHITGHLDFTPESQVIASQALELGGQDTAQALKQDITILINQLLGQVVIYRQRFDAAYSKWIMETHQNQLLQEAAMIDFTHGQKISISSKSIKNTASEEFATIMLEGLTLLNNIRFQLTGTQISTVFYIKDDAGKIKRITDANVKPVLSLYSASGTLSNPINLAYQIETECANGQNIIEKDEQDITHYLQILEAAKEKYLENLSIQKNKSYKAYYDATDMEILELLIQRKSKSLAWTHYQKYRKSFGNKGIQTTALEMGDIGNIQVKYFSNAKQNSVNAMRFSMLRNNLHKLETIFQLTNSNLQYQQLRDMFIPKTGALHDELSKEINRIALQNLKQLFGI